MEPAYHEYINFVVLAYVIFAFLDSLDELLLEFFITFSGSECLFRERQLN
jgi:hypothetical protein